jgi:hypothetical protein
MSLRSSDVGFPAPTNIFKSEPPTVATWVKVIVKPEWGPETGNLAAGRGGFADT